MCNIVPRAPDMVLPAKGNTAPKPLDDDGKETDMLIGWF
jgi:hypothetical protein